MPKSPGRPRNWAALDAAHRRRGEMLTLFFDPDSEVFAQPVPAGPLMRARAQEGAV